MDSWIGWFKTFISYTDQPFTGNLRDGLNSNLIIEEKALYQLLDSCQKGSRTGQDNLYKVFYGYAMGICLRYSRSKEEAIEIVNDGFLKIFTKLDKYTRGLSFKAWLRKVMVNSAIDYYRRNEKYYPTLDISHGNYESGTETILDRLSERDIIASIQLLPPSYRIVFNLFVIEGYRHEEIAHQLNISVGTSKSNLAIARSKLQRILTQDQGEHLTHEQNG